MVKTKKKLKSILMIRIMLNGNVDLASVKTSFLSHVDRGRAQNDVGLMGQTDMRSREEKGAVNEA